MIFTHEVSAGRQSLDFLSGTNVVGEQLRRVLGWSDKSSSFSLRGQATEQASLVMLDTVGWLHF